MTLQHSAPPNPRTKIAAIVFASGLNGLCTVRSLGTVGVPVVAVVEDQSQSSARSRFCRQFLRRPQESVPDVVARIRYELGVERGVLIATSDDGAHQLARCAAVLPPGFCFAGPSVETVSILMDKRLEMEALSKVSDSLPHSLQFLPNSASQVEERLRYPIIIKPRTQHLADRHRIKNCVVANSAQLESFFEGYSKSLDDFVAQEVIPGADENIWQCNAVFNSCHELVSAFTFQKLGMAPPHFGVTTMGRSSRNADVIGLARSIGSALGYVGPAGFEFKLDARDSTYRYIEINPRHGMTNWFDTQCGVNTAYRTYCLALGDDGTGPDAQEEGLVFVDLFADLFSRLIDDHEPLTHIARRYSWLMLKTHRVSAYWLWKDPMPGVLALSRNVSRTARAAFRQLRRNVGALR